MPASVCKTTLLLQLRVLGFGLLQDWDVGVGVFPEHGEVRQRAILSRRACVQSSATGATVASGSPTPDTLPGLSLAKRIGSGVPKCLA
jgi:hypothetical protein